MHIENYIYVHVHVKCTLLHMTTLDTP